LLHGGGTALALSLTGNSCSTVILVYSFISN
jgi:hypothetical protein